MRPRVVVMVKVPRAGRVKTRLGRDIGMTAAAWWFRHGVARLLREIRDPRWQVVLSVSPDAEGMGFSRWPRDLRRIPQGHGDIGDRMARILRSSPAAPTLIVGGDVPGITRAGLAWSFKSLQSADAVIGPASDGGFWLIGMRRPDRTSTQIFQGVRWSGPHALTDTLGRLRGLKVAMIHELSDVDTAYDLMTRKPA